MKPSLLPQAIRTIAIALFLAGVPAMAQVDATAWTSIDGTTIWARLDGISGNRLILNLRGTEYLVPLGRLEAGSADKAAKLLGITPERAVELAACSSHPPSPTEVPRKPMAARVPAPAISSTGMNPIKSGVIRMTATTRSFTAPAEVPDTVKAAVNAGNVLQDKSYKWGGGRARLEDTGYDCSGSVSYVLIKAGLLDSPLTSGGFTRFGERGPGRWITIFARDGHVFMTLCGLRLDTGGHGGCGESGPRWRPQPRSSSGYFMRHPPGF